MRILSLLSGLLMVAFNSSGQGWEELNNKAIKLFEKREYEKAILFAEQAVAAVKKELGDNHIDYTTVLNNLALLFSNTYQFNKAEALFQEALSKTKKILGEYNSDYIISLGNLASLYIETGQYVKAKELYIEVIEIQKKVLGVENNEYASNLNGLATVYSYLNEFTKAEALYIEAAAITKKAVGESHSDYAFTLNNLANLYKTQGQYTKAEGLLNEIIRIQWVEFSRDQLGYARSLNNLAQLYQSFGKYKEAEALYNEVLEIQLKNLGEAHPDFALTLNDLASLYTELAQYSKAKELYTEALEIFRKKIGVAHPFYATILNNLASLYNKEGQYEKAEPLFLESLSIRKKILGENDSDYGPVFNNLASVYFSLGQYEKAEYFYIESINITKKIYGLNHPKYAVGLNNLATFYAYFDEYSKAQLLYIELMDMIEKGMVKTQKEFATYLSNFASLYYKMGKYEKAEPLYVDAWSIRKKGLGEEHSDYANSLNDLSVLYKSMGQYEKAEILSVQAKEIRKNILGESHPDYAVSLQNLALLYSSTGQNEKAESLILATTNIQIKNLKNIFTILSEKEKGNYLANTISLIQINNSFLYNYRKASSAIRVNNFDLQLFIKSLSLTQTRIVLESVRSSKDIRIQKLFKEWQGNKSFLAKQYSLPVDKRVLKLDSIEANTEALEKELTRKSAEFSNQQKAVNISMLDVQKNLQEDEAAIEFVSFRLYNKKWTDSIIYAAYILHKNDSVPLFVPLFEEQQLQQLLKIAGKSATSIAKNIYRNTEFKKKNISVGIQLYNLMWHPLEPYLKGIKKISYSPSGILHGIAFHALPVDSSALLMDKYELRLYTCTRQVALRSSENENIKPSSIVLFGDPDFSMDSTQLVKQRTVSPEEISRNIYTPSTKGSDINSWLRLPGTAQEVKKINDLFNENKLNAKSFTQTIASEENLKALSGNSPQILHIATHGFFLSKPDVNNMDRNLNEINTYTLANDPLLRSGLILSGGNYAWSGKTPIDGVEDGIVTAYEISQLNLSNTELVVLSACETALGDVKGSEGVFGLQRAFKMAGVKKMIVSLWQVPDKETAELMTSFYSYWMKGKIINEAFAQAQADMRKKYSPFYWAAFVLVE